MSSPMEYVFDRHRLAVAPWRAYLQVIRDNDAQPAVAAILAKWPVFDRGGPRLESVLDYTLLSGYDLIETCETLCDLQDEGIVVWDEAGQRAYLKGLG